MGLILVAIGWGLLALLTPCVFPMIPMTVSFFLKGSESASADTRSVWRSSSARVGRAVRAVAAQAAARARRVNRYLFITISIVVGLFS